jgi:hypothetical protein
VALPDWSGLTVAILATGPSIDLRLVDAVRAAGYRIVACGRAVELAPDADMLVVVDQETARRDYGHVAGTTLVVYLSPAPPPSGHYLFTDVELAPMPSAADEAFWAWWRAIWEHERDHPCPRCGNPQRCWQRRVGAAALEIVLSTGAAKIILLGYDGGTSVSGHTHFFDPDPLVGNAIGADDAANAAIAVCWNRLARKADTRGVRIFNATPNSRISTFECVDLEAVLAL